MRTGSGASGLQVIAAVSVIASSFAGKAIQAAFFYDLSGQTFTRYVISVDVYLLLFLGVGVFYARAVAVGGMGPAIIGVYSPAKIALVSLSIRATPC